MNILFISRAYPPVIGGIEKQNFEIHQALAKNHHVDAILNTRGKIFLPIFLFIAPFKIFAKIKQYDVVLLGDGVLTVFAWLIRLFSSKPVFCIVHGLDLTYSNWLYRFFWKGLFFHSVTKFIAVGNETIRQGIAIDIKEEKFQFIPNGVNISQIYPQPNKTAISDLCKKNIAGPVLLTLGRLVKRKGVVWFIEHVMPDLHPSIHYIVAGDGKEKDAILQSIKSKGLQERITFLGAVTEEEKNLLLSSCDIFVQPNIPVSNDMEGFGLVVLEAGLAGTFVIASRLEGLQDAIQHEINGRLLTPLDANEYITVINKLTSDPALLDSLSKHAQTYVLENYSWDNIAKQYSMVMAKTETHV